MRSIRIDNHDPELSYKHAKFLAWNAARDERMQDPTVMAWHSRQAISPRFDGGNPENWWEKYGEGNGGRLRIDVGEDYAFIMMDTRAYDTLDHIPLRNLRDDQGRQYVCYTPMLGDSRTPTPEACYPLDDWTADQY